MLKPMPEGERFAIDNQHVFRWCWLKFFWSAFVTGDVFTPRGIAVEENGHVRSCWMRLFNTRHELIGSHCHDEFDDPFVACPVGARRAILRCTREFVADVTPFIINTLFMDAKLVDTFSDPWTRDSCYVLEHSDFPPHVYNEKMPLLSVKLERQPDGTHKVVRLDVVATPPAR